MMMRALIASGVFGGVLALGCGTPSSVGTTASPAPAAVANNVSWPAPAPGATHTLMPTPKTVARSPNGSA